MAAKERKPVSVREANRQLVRSLCPDLSKEQIEQMLDKIEADGVVELDTSSAESLSWFNALDPQDRALVLSIQPEETIVLDDGTEVEWVAD